MQINKTLSDIWGRRHLGSAEQCYWIMYAVARAFQAVKILEIGTHRGFSATAFCQAVLDNKQTPSLTTVDNWSKSPEAKQAAIDLFKETGFDKYIEMVGGDSGIILPEVLAQIGGVDLALIDGDHSTPAIERDIECVKDHAKVMLLHDTQGGGQRYLKALDNEWRVISFPTRYVEGDGHLVGITVAVKK